ncbi:MAG: hypothetical protein ACREMA_08155 [Longimicrobiales bacterium]
MAQVLSFGDHFAIDEQSIHTILGGEVLNLMAIPAGVFREVDQHCRCTILTGGGIVRLYQQSQRETEPDTLAGRPIFYTEYCSPLGDEGDLLLVNWSQYLEGTYQPLQSAESVHVRWSEHERAFKFWLRNAGAPWWRSSLTPANGTAKLSPIITLATRA